MTTRSSFSGMRSFSVVGGGTRHSRTVSRMLISDVPRNGFCSVSIS